MCVYVYVGVAERKRARRGRDTQRDKVRKRTTELGSGSEEILCVGGGGLGWQKEDRG